MIFSKNFINIILGFFGLIFLIFLGVVIFQSEESYKPIHLNKVDFFVENQNTLNPIDYEFIKESDSYTLGFVSDTVFAKLDLSEFEDLQDARIVELSNPTFRIVDLYKSEKSASQKESMTLVSKSLSRFSNYLYPFHFFKVNIEKDTDYFLKIYSKEPINFSISIETEETFNNKYSRSLILVSIYIGIMLALFLYNLLLYFSVKDKVYFFYCLYILFISCIQLSLLGYSYYFIFQENTILYEYSLIVFSSLSGIFGIIFLKHFLQTEKFYPKLSLGLYIPFFVYVLSSLTRVLGMVSIAYSLTDLGGLLIVISFVGFGVLIAKNGYRPAYYFLGAWVFFLFGLLLFVFQNLAIINLGTFANLPMLFGTAFEAVVLSLALADRINILKKEKEKEQADKLRVLHENEELIKEQNTLLEQKVKLRTDELEQALRNLQNTQGQLVNQEKMASLGQLTAGIAHEINNPINFVSSNITPLKRDIKDIMEVIEFYRNTGGIEFTDTSKKKAKDLEEDLELDYVLEEVEQLLNGMEDGARRTVEIVKGLRIFSRVDEQDVKKVDLHDGINSTIILLNSSIPGKIRILREFGDLPMVECLAGKINQVFMNIINNAVHALTDHLEEIKNPFICIRTIANGDDTVTIEIEDNGPGMPDSVKQRIFEPFFTTKAVGKGTGLGLSIVYSIIENHKGILDVQSKQGEGTTFKITLPIYQSAQKYE